MLDHDNIDTDQLIPARFMSAPRSEGYGSFLLHDMRRDPSGDALADFPLNRHPDASVLVTGQNFGSGSSREAAVYALVDAGFRVIVSAGFGDIFAANAVNNGLLPAQVSAKDATRLIQAIGADTAAPAFVDLTTRRVRIGAQEVSFALDDSRAIKLMKGWDDIDLTLQQTAAIQDYRKRRLHDTPWAWPDTVPAATD